MSSCLIPVDEVPGRGPMRKGKRRRLFQEFVDSGIRAARVDCESYGPGTSVDSVYHTLFEATSRYKELGVRVLRRDGCVYLQRTDM